MTAPSPTPQPSPRPPSGGGGPSVAADPGRALAAGAQIQQWSAELKGLLPHFSGVCLAAESAAAETPCSSAYPEFESATSAWLRLLAHNADTGGNNTRAGGGDASQTDGRTGDAFSGTGGNAFRNEINRSRLRPEANSRR